jgi:hypothetical protein
MMIILFGSLYKGSDTQDSLHFHHITQTTVFKTFSFSFYPFKIS